MMMSNDIYIDRLWILYIIKHILDYGAFIGFFDYVNWRFQCKDPEKHKIRPTAKCRGDGTK